MTGTSPWGRWPLWRRLHVRAAVVSAALLLAVGATMVMLLQHFSAQTALEAGQRMNLGLARSVVEHQPPGLLDAEGRPGARMNELALHVMTINPAVEVYLLDGRGRVLAHALDAPSEPDPVGAQVDLSPVRRLLSAGDDAHSVLLPVLGTDPRAPGYANTFSVAAVQQAGGGMGYLYIVLNGSKAQRVAASLSNSDALRAMSVFVVIAVAVGAVVLGIAWHQLTRPLRQLTDEVKSFREQDGVRVPVESGDEISVLRHAVQTLRQRVAQQFQQLEDGDRQRRELVSNISHDLRTPLSSIQGYVETVLLRGDSIDAGARATCLRTALRHVELLGKRVGDLFELSKLDAGRVEPRHETFCLAELLQDVIQNYRLAAQQRGVDLRLAAGSHAQAKVRADIAMIERVLQNLIDNALRFTEAGGAVVLAIENHGALMQISVSDTGRGIERRHLPHIFERYWRVSEADDRQSPTSSGLGLAIVKRILDLHGTAVRVQSELARGTRFEFLLPRAA